MADFVGSAKGAYRSFRKGLYADMAYSAGLTRGTFRSPQYWSMAKFASAGAVAGATVGGASSYYRKDQSVARGMMTGAIYGASMGGLGRGGWIAGRKALSRWKTKTLGQGRMLAMNTLSDMEMKYPGQVNPTPAEDWLGTPYTQRGLTAEMHKTAQSGRTTPWSWKGSARGFNYGGT